jgi:hypothetical protein
MDIETKKTPLQKMLQDIPRPIGAHKLPTNCNDHELLRQSRQSRSMEAFPSGVKRKAKAFPLEVVEAEGFEGFEGFTKSLICCTEGPA